MTKYLSYLEHYEKVLSGSPVNTIYGLARSLLACGLFLTLVSNSTESLFPVTTEVVTIPASPAVNFSIFLLLSNHIVVAKLIALVVLASVIIGIYPRFTGIFHWYIAFSFYAGCQVIDGGDHAHAVLSLLMVPLTLLDSRKWHWSSSGKQESSSIISNSIAWAFTVLIRIQVSIIYLHAAFAKIGVDDWTNGTATYYWFTHHYHGAGDWIKPAIIYLMSKPYIVTSITWGTMAFEFLLFACIFLDPHDIRRKIFLILGILFHFVIVIIHGLVSFYFSMTAALILYLSNYYQPYQIETYVNSLRRKK